MLNESALIRVAAFFNYVTISGVIRTANPPRWIPIIFSLPFTSSRITGDPLWPGDE